MQKKILLFSFVCASMMFAQGVSKGKKDSMYVADVTVPSSLETSTKGNGTNLELKRLSDSFRSQLEVSISSTRVFQTVERERMKNLQTEQMFNASGATSGDDVRQFDMKGAQYQLFPKITAFELKKSVSSYGALNRQSSSVLLSATVQTKITDTSTGVTLPDIISVTKTVKQNEDMAKAGTPITVDMLVDKLSKELADSASWGLVNFLKPPKVLSMSTGLAMVNRGEAAGLQKGLNVKIYAVEEIEDDGEVYMNEFEVGSGQIVRSNAKQSYVKIMGENLGVAKGCIVKVVDEPKAQTAQPTGRAEQNFGTQPSNQKQQLTPGSSDKPW